jgi:hypothetical protein
MLGQDDAARRKFLEEQWLIFLSGGGGDRRALGRAAAGYPLPPDYWAKQADTDRRDIQSYYDDRGSISSDEAVQLRARVIVFEGSPEGAAWRRMMYLTDTYLSPAGQAELADLHRRYPGMPLKDHDSPYARYCKDKARELDRLAKRSVRTTAGTAQQTLFGSSFNSIDNRSLCVC